MKANVPVIEEAIFVQLHIQKIKARLSFCISVRFTNCDLLLFFLEQVCLDRGMF